MTDVEAVADGFDYLWRKAYSEFIAASLAQDPPLEPERPVVKTRKSIKSRSDRGEPVVRGYGEIRLCGLCKGEAFCFTCGGKANRQLDN